MKKLVCLAILLLSLSAFAKKREIPPTAPSMDRSRLDIGESSLVNVKCSWMRAHVEDCPACVASAEDLRSVIERCREFPSLCDPHTAGRLRTLMKQEFLRLKQ